VQRGVLSPDVVTKPWSSGSEKTEIATTMYGTTGPQKKMKKGEKDGITR